MRRARLPLAACLALTAAASAVPGAARSQPAPPVEPPAGLDSLMGLLAQRRQGHVSYQEEHFIGTLNRPLHSSGELLYVAPGHLEKRALLPKPETLVVDGGTITDTRGSHRHVLALDDYPQVVPLIESIRATLAGDRPALERLFNLSFSGTSGGDWHLRLVPATARVAQAVKQIEIGGSADHLQSVEILENDGDHSLLTLGAELPQ